MTAVGGGGDRLLLAASEQAIVFDSSGAEKERRRTGPGVAALALVPEAAAEGEGALVVGYQDGNVDVIALGAKRTAPIRLERTPSSPARRIVAGPKHGRRRLPRLVGMWTLRQGPVATRLLVRAREHRPRTTLTRRPRSSATCPGTWRPYADRCALAEVWARARGGGGAPLSSRRLPRAPLWLVGEGPLSPDGGAGLREAVLSQRGPAYTVSHPATPWSSGTRDSRHDSGSMGDDRRPCANVGLSAACREALALKPA